MQEKKYKPDVEKKTKQKPGLVEQQSSRKELMEKHKELEEDFGQNWDYFMEALQVEHSIKESNFAHVFSHNLVFKDKAN